jgi:SWI/SNF-related matrix-associated actin-dependent regulator of chromatin subfamily A member 5
MAPRSSRASGADTDTSMGEVSEPIRQLPVDPMVSSDPIYFGSSKVPDIQDVRSNYMGVHTINIYLQDVDETPDYTEDSDTNPNTTASSVVGEPLNTDGRKRRSEATQLRRSVFGKKHDILGESKVCSGISDSP